MTSEVGGQIHGISLDSFLQMAQMEKTTCTLTVQTGDAVGRLYLLKGDLIDAEAGEQNGQAAAFEIISWQNAVISIENVCEKKDNVIDMPLMNVLMEGMKLRDQQAAKQPAGNSPPVPPPAEAEVEIAPEAAAEPVAKKARKPRPRKAPAPPPPPKKKKKPFPIKIVAAAGLGLIVLIGVVMALGLFSSRGIEKDYQNVLAQLDSHPEVADQIRMLQGFIDTHETGEQTLAARAKIRELEPIVQERDLADVTARVEQLPEDDAYRKKAEALYNGYLEKYPQGAFSDEVRERLRQIPERLEASAYSKVRAAEQGGFDEKLAAYNRYLTEHPDGAHAADISRRLTDMAESYYRYLKEETAMCDQGGSWDKCIEQCTRFIGAFKENAHLEEVVALKISLQTKRSMAALKAEADQKGSDYAAALNVYLSYLKTHPDSMLRQQVRAEADKIELKIAQQAQWAQTKTYVTNSGKDISERIDRLERYIRENPSSLFTSEANALMPGLLEEKKTVEAQRKKQAVQQRQMARLQAEKLKRERQKARKLKLERDVAARIRQSGDRYRLNGNGTVSDTATGLTWTLLDSGQDLGRCLTYTSAANYVRGLQTGGFRDWRLPRAGELAGIYKNPPFFPGSGAPWYWSSEAYVKGYHKVANIVTSDQETVFNIQQERQDQCGGVRAVRP